MREIPLSRGMVALVDDADYDWLMLHKWSAHQCPGQRTWYAVGHTKVNGKWKSTKMHRLILGITDPKHHVDHRDHNGLNNQRYNLRVATPSQNVFNAVPRCDNTSGCKGVTFFKPRQKWGARIQVEGVRQFLGLFETKDLAIAAYKSAAVTHYGEFAP